MQFCKDGQIKYFPKDIKYKFDSNFVFYEDDQTHELFVGLKNEAGGRYRVPNINEELGTIDWFTFEKAVEKMSLYKDGLLNARQHFYYEKPVKFYRDLTNIKSLTIAVPTYNGAVTITRSLDSIVENLKEIPVSIEKKIIICTDHCTDDTVSIVKNFIEGRKDKKVIIALINNNGNKGKANALNKIFNYSVGELFGVVDDDVILGKKCILNLIKGLVEDENLRCVFSARVRLPLKSRNPWRLFWYWVLGIKFDVNPYDKPSGIVRGQSIMLRRENFVHFPEVLNEDQFLHYIYWPKTKEISNSIVYFNYVSSIYEYYRRTVRIKFGSKQMSKHFTKERIYEYSHTVVRNINHQKISQLSWKLKVPFMFYKFITFFVSICVKTKLRFVKNYGWYRFKQY